MNNTISEASENAIQRDFLSIPALTRDEMLNLLDHAIHLKKLTAGGKCPQPFKGKMAGLVFHKPSLRTRISFEVGMFQLGGSAMFITDREIELGVRETISDAAQVLSRYLDLIVIRTYKQSDVEELAQHAEIPVINALTDLLHPCQIFCDLLTIKEKFHTVEGIKVTYLGDGNNIARSWINAARLLDIDLWIATGSDTHPGKEFVANAMANAVGKVTITDNHQEAVENADVIYTDVWASMGEKSKAEERAEMLKNFQVNMSLLRMAKPSCIVMHCLPAERGKEITNAVIDSPQSVVFDQAENRLHGQKSLMMWCFGLA